MSLTMVTGRHAHDGRTASEPPPPRRTQRTAHGPSDLEPARPGRHRMTSAAVGALARWTPFVEAEICGLGSIVRPGAVCVDVGAAGGSYTTVLSRLSGPAGQVHSVEPLPFANQRVARLLNVGSLANVRRHGLALGAEPGTDAMRVPVGRFGLVTGRSFLDHHAGGPDPNREFAGQMAVAVRVDTLDSLCRREGVRRLDFVKIDVEGAELEVLWGGRRSIEAHRPVLLIEIESRHTARYGRTPDDVTAWLFERRYAMFTWQRCWMPARSIQTGTRNYLFRPLDRCPRSPRRVTGEVDPTAA
ncbi:MAG TPA: FkbM family methyltransferase [Acidimicrobiales bacterium]|nr:FkbM family methyltransferase [Acidimicrobiales bacterium]